ncbi:hypothetical protein ACUXST_001352 [Sphingomonas sp. F9_3S_D5_B_2]
MRLLFLASAVIIATGAGAAAPPEQVLPPAQEAGEMLVVNPNVPFRSGCPPTSRHEAARRGGQLKATPLDELPDADMYKAVYRRIDGCVVPVIARYGVASDAAAGR